MSMDDLKHELHLAYYRRSQLINKMETLNTDDPFYTDYKQDIVKELQKINQYIKIAENAIETLTNK